HPAPDTKNHKYTSGTETPATGRECGREEMGPTFDGGPKLIPEREKPNTQPDTKTRTQSQIPHKNTHTQRKHTQQWTLYTHTYSILPDLGSDTPEGQPAPGPRRWSPSFQGGDRQTAPAPAQTSAGTA
ncbi:hypothetical protein CHARACLAT_027709, partial [Characodon lateralis]|nr:hypothetical protein [Characodon lateralis]